MQLAPLPQAHIVHSVSRSCLALQTERAAREPSGLAIEIRLTMLLLSSLVEITEVLDRAAELLGIEHLQENGGLIGN